MPTDPPAPVGSGRVFVRASGVRKEYRTGARPVPALRGANMQIDEPGFYAIMGPSGSGKSTLLYLLAGLDRPDAGTIEVCGQRVDTLTEQQLTLFRRRQIGVIFQQFNLLPTLPALNNVMLPGVLDRRPPAELQERARVLLTELGLGDRMEHRPEALSGGEQQRVAIARALLFEPPVLFADEPSGALDTANSELLWERLGALARDRGMVIVMVTHEPAAAVHCREVFVIRDGVVAGQFETEGMHASDLVVCAADIGRSAQ
ncbi:MAG: ABC transporter ATP-binding protein [Phycisphaerae bacterium]|nr:ABC transporter ATP-binding protein [Phycisphaerae bacterium]